MRHKYMIYTQEGILENSVTRDEAIEKVKQYHEHGIDAYIVSQTEGERIKEKGEEFHLPKWE
ncbi:hypothetical protein CACET_c07620 [Clostridium aceticum]|uniref:Uncharacterized protein n=1 Tax=Clostridium aceticum TaxID=84022 RepID=A0A0D8I793_9CLOT|nr:hypothetical protein [Clostridium aceticum]AKL94272.1 hypothetical protein CACET_c07620 [Clostridium aceticum]KJF26118.1 hypothetical protein TZ02_14815 [Clostridium aceticum]